MFVGHPLDLIKVRLQTMPVPAPGERPLYTGMMDVARQTIAKDGMIGLYKGMSAPLIGITPIFAVCFWAFDLAKKLERQALGMAPTADLSLFQIGVAGGLSAIPTTAIMAPGERIKCILQVQGEGKSVAKYAGPLDVVKGVIKDEGVAGLFRGSAATLARDGSGSVAYFSVYEGIKRALTPEGKSLSPVAVVAGGGFAGVCNWLVAIPFDVVKSRIQTSPPGTYKNMLHCFRQLVATEGYAAMFKGLQPAMVRAFPANAACFMGVELSMKAMNALW